ncbi:MAG: DUF3618 domain-containing protein [Thermoleophilaceae bacterium]
MTEADKTRVTGEAVDDPEQLREQIEQDREELGDTVEALAEKADVKAQVQKKVEERKEQLGDLPEQVKQRPAPVAAVVGGVLAAFLLFRFLRRR